MADKNKILDELRKIYREIENEKGEEVKKVAKQVEAQYDFILEKIEKAIELVESGNVEDIVKITCYGNIGFCCGLEKPCPFRDIVLDILGISREDYKYLKEEFGKLMTTEEGRKKLKEFFNK